MLAFIATILSSGWPPPGHVAPRLLFGPTANHPDTIANETVALFGAALPGWAGVRSRLAASNGTLHIRNQVFAFMAKDPSMLATLATQANATGIRLSIEAGGAMCGNGSGVRAAENVLKSSLSAFIGHGGSLALFALESVFSRTHGSCPKQSVAETSEELASFAGVMAAALPGTKFYLYDALPHYSVGIDWPANIAGYGLELGQVLQTLKQAMARQGVPLDGFWADCPYEYSAGTLAPLPRGLDGFEKLAAAVGLVKGMGLRFGKTFNTQKGGSASDESFYHGTLDDFQRTTAKVPGKGTGGSSLDFVMVETWYTHPTCIVPESSPYTTAFTALAVFEQIGAGAGIATSRAEPPSLVSPYSHEVDEPFIFPP